MVRKTSNAPPPVEPIKIYRGARFLPKAQRDTGPATSSQEITPLGAGTGTRQAQPASQELWLDIRDSVATIAQALGVSAGMAVRKLIQTCQDPSVRSRGFDVEKKSPVDARAHEWWHLNTEVDLDRGELRIHPYSGGPMHILKSVEINDGDLRYWLEQRKPKASSAARGRPTAVDWDHFVKPALFKQLDHHGPPSPDDPDWRNQAAVERAVSRIIFDKYGFVLSESTVRDHTTALLRAWTAKKAGN
jgi:hypothetical protein